MQIAVIGAGGHSKVVQEMIQIVSSCEIKAILDDKFQDLSAEQDVYYGPITAAYDILSRFQGIKFIIAIGNNRIRLQVAKRLNLPDESYAMLVHPSAVVSPSAKLGSGSVVMPNAVINADVRVGHHAIINTGAIVEHDSVLGSFVHVAPKAALTGNVRAEEGSMIGAGATVIPGTFIGEWAVVGAGATVIRDIPPYSTAVGTPAKVIKKADDTETSRSA